MLHASDFVKSLKLFTLLAMVSGLLWANSIPQTAAESGEQSDTKTVEAQHTVYLPIILYDFLPFTVNARIYHDVDDLLMPGDSVGISATRNEADVPVDYSENGEPSKFDQALVVMDTIDEEQIGISKGITFSAIDDVSALLSQLPDDIEWVSYNTEEGMTPAEELNNLPFYVQQFADLVHQSGRKAGWAPTLDDLSIMEMDGRLFSILPSLDSIGVQGQRLLMLCGLHGETGNPQCFDEGQPVGFVEEIERRMALFNEQAPDLLVRVQLWFGTNTPQEAASAFELTQKYLDTAVFYANTSNGDSVAATRYVLTSLGRH